jgi:hypothetical protein
MATLAASFTVVGIILALGYLLLQFNSLWMYRIFDRALRNQRDFIPHAYEVPRYYVLNREGKLDPSVRWPGWDGWYFFLLPEDRNLPLAMIRASLMTGLYGLNGIDNYDKLRRAGLSSFQAVEYLTLSPTRERINGQEKRENHLSQHYLPKATDLAMDIQQLDVAITTGITNQGEAVGLYGRISGQWPHYTFQFVNPETGLKCALRYHGDKLVWWADIPHIFTYFAAFGTLGGEITYRRTASQNETGAITASEQVQPINGRGAFEHGFARKPFNYDGLWRPVNWLKKFIPSLNPVRYNYEVFIGDDHCRGGFMYARAFGIDYRNRGGVYLNDVYTPINRVKIAYLDHPPPDIVDSSGQPEKFYRRWKVRAETNEGVLEYTGTREWPPPCITGHMIYYTFSYEGSYLGQPIGGRGYGEYLHM